MPSEFEFDRREFLRRGAAAGFALAAAPLVGCGKDEDPRQERVAIIGAGLAGLTCAYRLQQAGIPSTVFEARADRVGGRCFTARDFADGQVAEHGGEFIDTEHERIRALAMELGLELEDRRAASGDLPEVHGARYFEDRLVESRYLFRGYEAMVRKLRRTSAAQLDSLSASEWLDLNVPAGSDSPLGRSTGAYLVSDYGLEPEELSGASLLGLVGGSGADERFHVAGGNDQVATRMADMLPRDALTMDAPLTSLRATDDGYELEVAGVGALKAERVVLAAPFTTLRDVDLEEAKLSSEKTAAIDELGMATNSKLLLPLRERPEAYGDWSGNVFADHPFQYSWDTSLTQDGRAGLITVYYGGEDGAGLPAPEGGHGSAPPDAVREVLSVLELAAPGIRGGVTGEPMVSNWSLDQWAKGSYAAFEPGQTTDFAEVAGRAEGGIHFAGEHTSIEFQGYLEGAVESGERAAREVAVALRHA